MRSAAVLLLISSAPLSLAATIGAADLFATSGRQLQSDGCEDDCSACCPCDGTPCGEECRDRDMCLENSQGCYESLCTSSGNDCCVGEGEALTCSNGFVPQIIGEGCFFNMGRTYTCCPPGVTLISGNGGGSGITEKDPDYESDPGYDSSTSVTFALTASGSVTDYDEGKQALMRSDIARAASVAVDSVFLSITSASVRIAVEIVVGTLTDGMAVEGVLTTLLSDPASASAVFTSVTVPVESIAARPSATSTAQAGTCSPAYCTSPTDESSPFPNDCWAGTAFEACTCSRGEAQTTGLTLEYDGDTYHQYTCCDQGGSGEVCGDYIGHWFWIVFGVVGFLIIVSIVVCIYCCCKRGCCNNCCAGASPPQTHPQHGSPVGMQQGMQQGMQMSSTALPIAVAQPVAVAGPPMVIASASVHPAAPMGIAVPGGAAPRFCMHCGTALQPSDRFCGKCGVAVGGY